LAEDVHSLVETVVAENVASIQKRLEELELHRADTENAIVELRAIAAELKDNYLALHEGTSKKLTEYNSKLDTIAGQIAGLKGALEKLISKR
jgi:prefoldin subunit 5